MFRDLGQDRPGAACGRAVCRPLKHAGELAHRTVGESFPFSAAPWELLQAGGCVSDR